MNIAILGFGVVGKGVAEIIGKKATHETRRINIKKILVKTQRLNEYDDEKKQNLYLDKRVVFVDSIDDIVNDDSIDLVVECIGGVNPAYEYVDRCLERGKRVVTSNKMLLATKYPKLIMKYGNNISYEATVGGGIHIFHSINDIKMVDNINSFKGIVNGTTNYILSKMTDMVLNNPCCDEDIFEKTLKEAQKLGFAEADPTNDIDGYDAMYKAILLYNEIFEECLMTQNIDKLCEVNNMEKENNKYYKRFYNSTIEGIRNITKKDIIEADNANKVIKLIAYGNKKEVCVRPKMIEKDDYLAHINSNLNAIIIESENLGVSTYVGQGAGKLATAHAIVLDICGYMV